MRVKLDGAAILITGASSGIGREMARQLGPRCRALVLVARRADRLDELRNELIAASPNLQVRLVPCDLSDLAQVERLPEQVRAAIGVVDVLINNAGSGDAALLERSDWSKISSMMMLNVNSLVCLTRHFFAEMTARGRGAILNVSSSFGFSILPGFATYLASKHFATAFTETLRIEAAGTGVVISQLCPGPVDTEFNEVSGSAEVSPTIQRLARITPATCARVALAGLERGRAMIVPGVIIKILKWILAITPNWFIRLTLYPYARSMRSHSTPSK